MPDPIRLSSSEQELLGQVAGFAARRAENGVYLNLMHSRSLAAPVLLLVAIGDQALALQKIVMGSAIPESQLIEPEKSNGQW
jgi:hypothetical protein